MIFTIGISVFLAMLSGGWVLLKALVSTPINNLTKEIAGTKLELKETNKEIKELTSVVTNAKGEILVINQWRVDIDRRMERLEEKLTKE
ncbi:MAG: hypothetical protein ACXVB4_01380 [Pseudobdellovibrionaceae bacterium]